MTLQEWEREHTLFQLLIKIPFFKNSKTFKSFMAWKKVCSKNMQSKNTKIINERSFLMDPTLREFLIKVREMCENLYKESFLVVQDEPDFSDKFFEK